MKEVTQQMLDDWLAKDTIKEILSKIAKNRQEEKEKGEKDLDYDPGRGAYTDTYRYICI